MKPAVTGGQSSEQAVFGDFSEQPRRRSVALRRTLIAFSGFVFIALLALGTWQVKRLFWKLDLIERVEQRVHAPATPAPARDRWSQINAASDEYRHVSVTGTFLYSLTTRTQASTEFGSGFWLLTPLRSAAGSIVLVNRGFISTKTANDIHKTAAPESPIVTVTGLLRISEPIGSFLRHNDPAANHWYSRDVEAIAAARGITNAAPYFVDADAGESISDTPDRPIGGLTIIAFPNNHLVYAITWYALASMLAGALWWAVREEKTSPSGTAEED